MSIKEKRKAIRLLKKAIRMNKKNLIFHNDLASAYANFGYKRLAIYTLKYITVLFPTDPANYLQYSIALYEFGKLKPAIKNLKEATEIFPNNLEVLQLLIVYLSKYKKGDKEIPLYIEKLNQTNKHFSDISKEMNYNMRNPKALPNK